MKKSYKKWELTDTLRDAHKKYNENLDISDDNLTTMKEAIEELVANQDKLYPVTIDCWNKSPEFWYPYIAQFPTYEEGKKTIATLYCVTDLETSRPNIVNPEYNLSLYSPQGVRISGKFDILLNEFRTITGTVLSRGHRDNRIPITVYYNFYQNQLVIWCLGGLKYSFLCTHKISTLELSSSISKRRVWGGWVAKSMYFTEIEDKILETEDNTYACTILPEKIKSPGNKSIIFNTIDSNGIVESYMDGDFISNKMIKKVNSTMHFKNPLKIMALPLEFEDKQQPLPNTEDIVLYVEYDTGVNFFGTYIIVGKEPREYRKYPIRHVEFIGFIANLAMGTEVYGLTHKELENLYTHNYVRYDNKIYAPVAFSGIYDTLGIVKKSGAAYCEIVMEYNSNYITHISITNKPIIMDITKSVKIGFFIPDGQIYFEGGVELYHNNNTKPT